MKKVLILFAHPRFEKSRTNRVLLSGLEDQDFITIHDLYELYPDFNIDVEREQALLLEHEIVVWHSPFFLYGAPAMIKQWTDLVLQHGWAHGIGGQNLEGKLIFNTVTTGGTRESYAQGGFNRYTISELLRPWEQIASLCGMIWLPPFTVQGTYRLNETSLEHYAEQYRQVLHSLAQSPSLDKVREYSFLNDWIADPDLKVKS